MPVFSFEKLRGADIGLGPEMKSTGEVLGIAKTFHEALYKAFLGAGIRLPKTPADGDHGEGCGQAERRWRLAGGLKSPGIHIYSPPAAPADVLNENGVFAIRINKLEQESPNLSWN